MIGKTRRRYTPIVITIYVVRPNTNLMPTPRTKLVKQLDKLCSEYVRAKNNHIYEHCGKEGKFVHHYFGRRHYLTRWEPDNLICICWACHRYWAHQEYESCRQYLVEKIGGDRFYQLKRMSNDSANFKISDYEEMVVEFKEKLKTYEKAH